MSNYFHKPGCRPLGLDETIQPGDWVAECEGEELSIGTPGPWHRANQSIGETPRHCHLFACRPILRTVIERAMSHEG